MREHPRAYYLLLLLLVSRLKQIPMRDQEVVRWVWIKLSYNFRIYHQKVENHLKYIITFSDTSSSDDSDAEEKPKEKPKVRSSPEPPRRPPPAADDDSDDSMDWGSDSDSSSSSSDDEKVANIRERYVWYIPEEL